VTVIQRWREEFERLDALCPWPGPRPLSSQRHRDKDTLLVGRTENIRSFVDMVRTHALVVLHGDSGVGKSSLLNVGLVNTLRANDYETLVCGDWAGVAQSTDPEVFVAEKLREQGVLDPEVTAELDRGRQLMTSLDDVHEDAAVLVLDQFEELIRYQPERFGQTIEWLLRVNRGLRVRIVLSLRSEYVHRLKDLNSRARPFSMSYTSLEALSVREDIQAVIRSADGPDRPAIDRAATELLLDEWERLGPSAPTRTLLHLQATLMAVHASSVEAGRSCVTTDDVDGLRARGGNLFTAGFDAAIALKLDRCAQACAGLEPVIDPVLIEGTRAQVRESVTHLSSGGYKLVREEWDLAERTLLRELDMLCARENEKHLPQGHEAEQIVRALSQMRSTNSADPLEASRAEIAAAAGLDWPSPDEAGLSELERALAEFGVRPAPWETDPLDLSSGVMLGLGPSAVLLEELRRFTFAMEWLTRASLIRASTPQPDQTMVSLIHDGFCNALETWVDESVSSPAAFVATLTAVEGQRLLWRQEGREPWPEFCGTQEWAQFLVNLRWRYSTLTADFRRVVFVNCDLRGVRFVDCTFEGVVFLNCLLDGASFEECVIIGKAVVTETGTPTYLRDTIAGTDESPEDPLPEFVVPIGHGLVHSINRYRGTSVDGEQLYSATSGVAAVPWASEVPAAVEWEDQHGGMTMYGGRLSSLMIRNCEFRDGSMALCHIAGSSLDIVEQASGSFLISYSTIRGLTLTHKVGERSKPRQPLVLDVSDCVLADTWFGEDLHGRASFRDTRLWHLMNTSDHHEFEVLVDDCSYHGLVNVSGITDNCLELTGYRKDLIEDRKTIVTVARKMSYRSVPARLELERRARARRT
jgi:Pentapeptide repeats (9 copies)